MAAPAARALMPWGHSDGRRDGGSARPDGNRARPWASGGAGARPSRVRRTGLPRAGRQAEDVLRRQGDLQEGCLDLGDRHRPAVHGDRADCASFWRAQARSSPSVAATPGVSPANVLHSNALAATKIFVPGLTVQDSTPPATSGASVWPRSKQPDAEPPVPNGFWALGVRAPPSTAPRGCHPASSSGRRAPAQAATQSDTAPSSRMRARRAIANLPDGLAGGVVTGRRLECCPMLPPPRVASQLQRDEKIHTPVSRAHIDAAGHRACARIGRGSDIVPARPFSPTASPAPRCGTSLPLSCDRALAA